MTGIHLTYIGRCWFILIPVLYIRKYNLFVISIEYQSYKIGNCLRKKFGVRARGGLEWGYKIPPAFHKKKIKPFK